MNRLVIIAYAVGGACFAILISGTVTEQFCDANPWTVGFLLAGVISTIGTAALWESGREPSDPLLPVFTCSLGIVIASMGLCLYFFNFHPALRYGGALGAAVCGFMLWEGYWKRPKK